jgi:hypothetical protein
MFSDWIWFNKLSSAAGREHAVVIGNSVVLAVRRYCVPSRMSPRHSVVAAVFAAATLSTGDQTCRERRNT